MNEPNDFFFELVLLDVFFSRLAVFILLSIFSGLMAIYWIYGVWRRFMKINKWRFQDYYLLFYFGGYGRYSFVLCL